MLKAERNRLHLSHTQSYESIRSIISALKGELARNEGEMAIHIKDHFSELSDLLSAVKGMGLRLLLYCWLKFLSFVRSLDVKLALLLGLLQ